jgi:hypothetical protein
VTRAPTIDEGSLGVFDGRVSVNFVAEKRRPIEFSRPTWRD